MSKFSKKALVLLLMLAMVLTFAACGGDDSKDSEGDNSLGSVCL